MNKTTKKNENTDKADKPKTYRVPITKTELKTLNVGLEDTSRGIFNAVREKLGLPPRTKNTRKAQALAKLGLSRQATAKEIYDAILG